MTPGTSNALVNVRELTKPADTLIKKVSKAVSGIFAPYQVERMAKAEAAAAVIKAQTEIQITDLHRRAMRRFVEEEAQRQQNIEDITNKALPQLSESSDPGAMEDDWVTNFFDKSRIVSDREMQNLWSRVLAGEANAPGTYSRRTVNFLSDLDKVDAEMFQSLCRFCWEVGSILVPLVFDAQDPIYNRHGIKFTTLAHLESIGLIQLNVLQGFVRTKVPKKCIASYAGRTLVLKLPKDSDNELQLGNVLLTKLGSELAMAVAEVPVVEEFFDYVKGRWSAFLTQQTELTQGATLNAGNPGV